MLTLKLLSLAALVGCLAWLIHEPDYEPAIASIGALSTLIGSIVIDRKRKNSDTMHQSVASGAVGIQAGGDVTTGNIIQQTTEKKNAIQK